MRKRDLMALFVAAALLAVAPVARADATGSFSRTLKVSGPVDLDVTTGSGNITIRTSSDANSVQIYAKIRASNNWLSGNLSPEERVKRIEADPPVKQNGNSIEIGRIDEPELKRNVSISYEITVPASTRLHSQTGSGDQRVDGIAGPVRASTGSGNIEASGIGGETRVSTGSGDVRLNHIKGRVYANTGSGNVVAEHVEGGLYGETGSGNITYDQEAAGDVVAKTGSGNVRLRNVKGGVEAHTGSGDVEVDGDARNEWVVHTGSGSVNLRLPSNANFDLDARSSSGSVTVDHPVTISGTMRRNRIQGKVGSGGPRLDLETGSGDIVVR